MYRKPCRSRLGVAVAGPLSRSRLEQRGPASESGLPVRNGPAPGPGGSARRSVIRDCGRGRAVNRNRIPGRQRRVRPVALAARVGRVAGGRRPATHDPRPRAKSATPTRAPERPGPPGPARTFCQIPGPARTLSGTGFIAI